MVASISPVPGEIEGALAGAWLRSTRAGSARKSRAPSGRRSRAGGIVHGHVHVLPANAPYFGAAITGDPMPDAPDPGELLDVEMHQTAGLRPLVALHRNRGRELPQPGQSLPAQQAPRLRDVVRAFLWMFIRVSPSAGMVGRQPSTSQRWP
jgi:hypothetical protein